MEGEQNYYFQNCSMTPDEIDCLQKMQQKHEEFSQIGIHVNADRETYDPILASHIPEGSFAVTLQIPCEGIDMASFYKEFNNALQERINLHQERAY